MKHCILILAAAGLASTANAQFYGGDFNGVNGLSSEKNTQVTESMTYDNFHWAGGPIQLVYGNFLQGGLNGGVAGGEWEIRSGVSEGNGGVLVMSGNSLIDWVKKGDGAFGLEEWTLTLAGNNQNLTAGDYWIGVRPIGFGKGEAYASTTSGTNGIGGPLNDGNSFINSSYFGYNFLKAENVLGVKSDFSYGVIPAPGALSLLGLGGLMAARRRR